MIKIISCTINTVKRLIAQQPYLQELLLVVKCMVSMCRHWRWLLMAGQQCNDVELFKCCWNLDLLMSASLPEHRLTADTKLHVPACHRQTTTVYSRLHSICLVTCTCCTVMGKSQIKSLTQISNLSRTGFKPFVQISNPHFCSSPKSFMVKSQIFHNSKKVNKFSIASQDSHIWCDIFRA